MARKKTVEPAYVSEDTIEDIPVVQRLQAIAVEPGDLLVVTVPQGLPRETVMAAGRAVGASRRHHDPHPVGVSVAVQRPAL